MAYVITEPQLMASVAVEINGIGANLSAANAAAAGRTTSLAAAAADEISAALAKAFGAYGAEYQSLVGQLEGWHGQFTQTLTNAGTAYAGTETAIASGLAGALGVAGGSGAALSAATIPPFPANMLTYFIGGTGTPIPSQSFVTKANNLYVRSVNALTTLVTPEQLYPLTGVKSLVLDTSVSEGVTILDQALYTSIHTNGQSVTVFGISQSAIISSLEMRNLANGTSMFGANPPDVSQLNFVLTGNEMNPNGGLLSRFPNLSLPALGLTFYGSTPADTPYHVANYTREYDGFADFPKYPINVVSDLNAMLGIVLVHPTYLDLPLSQVNAATQLATSPGYTGNTSYYIIHTENLPLLAPLRAIPGIGTPLADLIQPDMKVIVNLGYGDPNFGYSTSPADLPTPFGLFPSIPASTITNALSAGTQQGIQAFSADLQGMAAQATNPAAYALPPAPVLATAAPTFPSPAKIVNTLTSIVTTDYATLLPTADIGTTLVTTLPLYDTELFVDQLSQGNLLNAVGFPIAADVGLGTVAGGVEVLTLVSALSQNVKDLQGLFAS
ncbi:MAG: PE family protein [Mycobacterium sp.]